MWHDIGGDREQLGGERKERRKERRGRGCKGDVKSVAYHQKEGAAR